jgi:hypothetical protein
LITSECPEAFGVNVGWQISCPTAGVAPIAAQKSKADVDFNMIETPW